MDKRRITALMAGVACIVAAFAAGCNSTPADDTASPAADGTAASPAAGGTMASPAAGGGAPSTPGVGGTAASPAAPPGPAAK